MRISIGKRSLGLSKSSKMWSAYVLLGDPGAGKTTAFKTERKKLKGESLP